MGRWGGTGDWGERPHLNKVARDFLCAEVTEDDLDGVGQAGRRAL